MNHKMLMKKSTMKTAIMNWSMEQLLQSYFQPPPEVIEEWNHRFDDEWKEPEPTLENTSVYLQRMG